MEIDIQELLDFLRINGIETKYVDGGNSQVYFESFCPLNEIKEKSITWARDLSCVNIEQLNDLKNVILITEWSENELEFEFPIIYVKNVRRIFFKVIAHFFGKVDYENESIGICQSAIVESDKIGEKVHIGHHSFIGKDVILGDNVRIYHNVTIQGRCEIGEGTVIESGSSIGVCGFGFYMEDDGIPVCVPHLGGVKIGKYVKIGANNTIARGTLGDTIIEDYVKTDNLCHIAHNDHIKKGAILTANTVVGGSTVVGENVWTGPGSLLNNSIHVGDNSFLGLGTVATKDVPAGKVVAGVPFRVLRDREF